MIEDRRAFLAQAGKLLVLTGAASLAWDHVVAGEPEAAPNYKLTDHWWAMMIDIDKCIGCGNCVRACKAENNVPLTEGTFRTWVERYEVNPDDLAHPHVDSPNGGYDGFPEFPSPVPGAKVFFVPKLCNHCADSPCAPSAPPSRAPTASCSSTSRTASDAATAFRPVRTAAGTSIRAR
jgi:tetrathionate reductase subunit B